MSPFPLEQLPMPSPSAVSAFAVVSSCLWLSSPLLPCQPAPEPPSVHPASLALPTEERGDGDSCISHTLSSSLLPHRHSRRTAPIIWLANDTNFPSQALPVI